MQDDRRHSVSPQAGTFGMVLFLVSLAILFAAGMLVYVLIRTTGTNRPDFGTVYVPAILWGSTFVLLISSATVQMAVAAVRREKQARMRGFLLATLLLSLIFLVFQVPGLYRLHQAYQPKQAAYQEVMQTAQEAADARGRAIVNTETGAQYPQEMHVIALVLVHGLHVVGGLGVLLLVTLKAYQGRYDHERYGPVRYTAWYWHFLDAVWIIMLAIIAATA